MAEAPRTARLVPAGRLLLALVATLALGAVTPRRAASAPEPPVLVVGDSLEVGTGPYLRRELSSQPLTVDARTGRPSTEGVGVLRARLRPQHRIVVFDLGTNDDPSQPARLASDLAAARRLAGDRCLVVSTLSRPPLAGVPIDRLNQVVRDFVAQTPAAVLVDWRAEATAHPALLSPDGVHPVPQGYAIRARLVADGVRRCLAAAPSDLPAPRRRTRPPPRVRRAPRPGLGDLLRPVSLGLPLAYVRAAVRMVESAVRHLPRAHTREPVLGRE